MRVGVCLCTGEVILKRDDEDKIRKNRGVHLVDCYGWGGMRGVTMCGRHIWMERRGL